MGQALYSALALGWAVAVARALGVEGKGTVSALLLVAAVAVSIGLLGTREGISYYVARRRGEVLRQIIRIAFAQSGLLAALTSITVLCTKNLGLRALSGLDLWVVVIVGPLAGLTSLFLQLQSALVGLGRMGEASASACVQVAAAIALFAAAWAMNMESVVAAIIAYLVGQAIGVGVSLHFLSRYIARGAAPNPREMRGFWRYSIKASAGGIAQFLNYRLDQGFVAGFVGARGLGLYSAAVNVAEIAEYPNRSIAVTSLPAAAGHPHLQKLCFKVIAATIVIGGIGCCLMWLVGPWILATVLGPSFVAGSPILRVLILGGTAAGIARVAGSLASGAQSPEVASYSSSAGAILALGGCVWALPRFGVMGAAWVSVAAYSLSCLLSLIGLAVALSRTNGRGAQQ